MRSYSAWPDPSSVAPAIQEARDTRDPVSLTCLDPPMDVEALEQAALAAVAAASSTDAIEAVRVEYLGRKSELKLALREVRDRATGMTLNAARERMPAAAA